MRNNYDYKKLCPFKWFVLQNFPFIEADFDAITNWQLFCKLGEEMNKVIDKVNESGEQVENLTNAFNNLYDYVTNYFDNLDVQEEIDNKLDDMVEDGSLQEIISDYLNSKAVFGFDTVASMKSATNLIDGSYAKTLGYYAINDNGGATYKIVDDNTLVDNGGSIHELNNGLFAKLISNDYVTVEQFGAKGDGLTDDSEYIQNAVDYATGKFILKFAKKTYIVNDILTLQDNIYEGNNATIKINFEGERERESQIINTLFFGDGSSSNKIQINNLNIEDLNSPYAQTISVCNCELILNNININKYHAGSAIDLYGGNSNSIINECNVNINVENLSSLASCILVRGFGYQDTNNVIINKCNLSQNSLDETIWVSSGYRSLKNIKINNNILNDLGNSDDTVFLGVNRTGSIEDVIFSNNIINKANLVDRCISIARTQNIDKTLIPHKNIIFSNNIINVTEGNSSNNRILCYCYSNNDYFELLISNNEFNYLGNVNIKSVVEGNTISDANKLNCTNSNYAFQSAYISKNDYIKTVNGYKDVNTCSNITADLTDNFVNDTERSGITHISNCKITCNYFVNLNKANGSKYYLKNNTVNTSNTQIINNYNPTSTPTIILMDNVLIGDTKPGFIKNNACDLIAKNNFYTSSSESGEYKGIPGYSLDRASYVVGSVLFSNTAAKSIVRKISSGDQTSNWEDI